MELLKKAEDSLGNVFKNAPKLPENAKKTIVDFAPWVTLLLGILMLASAWWLWDWANSTTKLVDYANELSRAFGGKDVASDRLTVVIWLGLIAQAAQAVLYILAYSGLKARKKGGWNLLFYAALVNIAYGVIILFTDYGTFGNFLASLVGSAIGFYFLYQIRPYYNGRVVKSASGSPTV